ncbi:MAG: hypothetical protein KC940_16220, partial [Candidatus Omnitrophica bacterium]|nr:hypothetical protein [Candidatus Omnitrophota bacterium]
MKAMFSGRVGLWILGVAALISFVDSGWTVSPATGDLWIGWASTEITPDRPVALVGQKHKRVSTRVRDPLTATALAIETKNEQGDMIDQAVMVS